MAIATRPAPDYVGNQAAPLVNYAVNRLQTAFDRVRGVFHNLGNAVTAATYGLRQEVPFERWFFDHGFQKPIEDPVEQMKARGWALLAALEGGVRTIAEVSSFLFAKILVPNEAEEHLDVLKAQWQGVTLSLLAVIFPNLAKEQADKGKDGAPLIGSSLPNWKWGTPYLGKLDIPLWQVECRHYPWYNRP